MPVPDVQQMHINTGSVAEPVSPRSRTVSTPFNHGRHTSSSNGLGGPMHPRTRSISTPYTPPLPSPLSPSFQASMKHSKTVPSFNSASVSMSPSASFLSSSSASTPSEADIKSRRHSRIHSRNLSVFFPRPGSLPTSAISEMEDGGQEIEIRGDEEMQPPSLLAPPGLPSASSISSSSSRGFSGSSKPATPLGQGFTFGSRPPVAPQNLLESERSTKRRGHHHRHSLSHNFFSFLGPMPTTTMEENKETESAGEEGVTPAVSPVAAWTTTVPDTAVEEGPPADGAPLIVVIAQFILGAWMWVMGQQVGSLSVTGVGYWVVFDSFGVWMGGVRTRLGSYKGLRRPYGNARLETLLMFAQVVYLMFSSVYVCKETVEHLLLSAGEGHHHHHNDEDEGVGIDFPVWMMWAAVCSVTATAALYGNHAKLERLTFSRLATFTSTFRSLFTKSRPVPEEEPTSLWSRLSRNPFVITPILFSLAIIATSMGSLEHHRLIDLALAALLAVVTFKVAYQACVVLGEVLLQTSPQRGAAGGRIENFQRVTREIERHPLVVHLPPPHIWQLAPGKKDKNLVVTLQVHVREDTGDDQILDLTNWVWERVSKGCGAEVTVGVVRG